CRAGTGPATANTERDGACACGAGGGLMALLLALVAAYGVFLVYTAWALGWSGVGLAPAVARAGRRARTRDWMAQAGLEDVDVRQFGAVMAVLFLVGAALAFALFGGAVPALVSGAFAA